jgi:hypothetical protein
MKMESVGKYKYQQEETSVPKVPKLYTQYRS